MTMNRLLESFDSLTVEQDETPAEINQTALENERLASFEKGYSAGWEDAIKAQADDQKRVSSDLAQNLQDMSFTYHEAVAHLNKSIEPLLHDLVEKILPQMAMATMGATIVEQLSDLARTQAQAPVEITVCPAHVETVNALVGENIQQPFEITAEPSLGEGQAFIRFGANELEIDTTQVIEGIHTAVSAFIFQNNKESVSA